MDSFDLSALDTKKGAEAGAELTLRHPKTNELTPVKLLVLGYDSDAYQEAQDERQRKRLERLPHHRPTVEELNEDSLYVASMLVAGFVTPLSLDGQALAYSRESAKTLLRRFPWVREQVEDFAGKRGNFLPGSASS